MNKELKKLSVTPDQIGYCLLCGGENGKCTCSAAQEIVNPAKREFIDLCRGERRLKTPELEGNADYMICGGCGSIVAFLKADRIVRCTCERILKHEYVAPVIPEPDYSILDGLSDLPSRASRKPKTLRSRNFPGSGNG